MSLIEGQLEKVRLEKESGRTKGLFRRGWEYITSYLPGEDTMNTFSGESKSQNTRPRKE